MTTKKSIKSIDQKIKKSASDKKKPYSTEKVSPRQSMIRQLTGILNDLNEEGLLFLIRQAQILQYNMNVDIINSQNTAGSKKTDAPEFNKRTVEIIEGENNRDFIIVINNARNFLTLDEMKKIVKICHDSSDSRDASHRLHQWFSKFRFDVIKDTKITGKNDPALETIYNVIINKYTVKN